VIIDAEFVEIPAASVQLVPLSPRATFRQKHRWTGPTPALSPSWLQLRSTCPRPAACAEGQTPTRRPPMARTSANAAAWRGGPNRSS